eukprot:588015-Heterocapsa_arctica.AAC.1
MPTGNQDTHSCVDNEQEYTFVFSSSCKANDEHHGVGICYNKTMERYSNYYQQVDSNVMGIEINMHGNPLIIMCAYVPHDAAHGDKRLKVLGNLSDRINHIPPSKNLISLGDFNAQLHARKDGEEQYIGPH